MAAVDPETPPTAAAGPACGLVDDILAQTGHRISVIGTDYRYRFTNRPNLEFYGLPAEAVLGRHVAEIIGHERFETRARAAFDRCFAGEHVTYVHDVVRPDGGTGVVEIDMRPFRDGERRVVGALVTVLDVTERERAVRAVAESERRLATLMGNLPGMVYRTRRRGDSSVTEFVSDGVLALTGHTVARATGVQPGFVLSITHPDDLHRTATTLERSVATAGRFEMRYRILTADGRVRHVWERGRASRQDDGSVLLEGFITDISEAHRLAERLHHQATHDSLTGLRNRHAFDAELTAVAATATPALPAALLYLDLDRFKVINDTCGHIAGDEFLRQLTRNLHDACGADVVVGRLGGDEFGLLARRHSVDEALALAERLQGVIRSFRFVRGGTNFAVDASIGVVPFCEAGVDPATLMVRADNACRAAKQAGRGCVHVYREGDVEVDRLSGQSHWLARVQAALRGGGFQLHQQPIRALHDGVHVDRCEMLLRLVDERGEALPAERFLPAAERHGLAVAIDRWVVGRVVEWLRANPDRCATPGSCAVNVTGQSLANADFHRFLAAAVGRAGVDAARLCLEVTESAVLSEIDGAARAMNELRRLGCRFALDAFGHGITSLAHLEALPVDVVKLDGVLVRGVAEHAIDAVVVRAIVQAAAVIGAVTVAEGVETPHVLGAVRELGVDYAQGHAIGAPTPLDTDGTPPFPASER